MFGDLKSAVRCLGLHMELQKIGSGEVMVLAGCPKTDAAKCPNVNFCQALRKVVAREMESHSKARYTCPAVETIKCR